MTKNNESPPATIRHNEELLAMVRIASTVLRHREVDDILSAITCDLAQLIEFDRASVALFDSGRECLVLQHIYMPDGTPDCVGNGRKIPLDESTVIGWVALNQRPRLRRDVANDTRFTEVVMEAQLGSDMVVPLLAHGSVIGTLNAGSRTPGAFDDSDLDKLVNCSSIVSGVIEHALLLREAKDLGERYRTLQRNASDIIMLIDRSSGRIVEVNRKCCEVLGQTEKDLLRKTYFDLFPVEDQFQARRDFINIMSRKSHQLTDRRVVGHDGKVLFVDISAGLIQIKSDTFIQVLVHDITQRKMLEQQIILQNRDLQEINRKLREVDEMKTEFLANISHELRTPLSVIIAYTEALRAGIVDDADRLRFVDVIADNGENLLRLINDLLDLSKLEVSGTMLSFTLSHIHDVVRSLWPKILAAAQEKNIQVDFEADCDVPVVYIDNRRIGQVIVCLLQNAIKFTEPGGTVTLATERTDDGVVIRVSDTGAGIPEEKMPRIFDTFRQLDGSSTRRQGGLGIGLAIARHIVQLHGGKIWAESKAGAGSVFAFLVPVGTAEFLRAREEGLASLRTVTMASDIDATGDIPEPS